MSTAKPACWNSWIPAGFIGARNRTTTRPCWITAWPGWNSGAWPVEVSSDAGAFELDQVAGDYGGYSECGGPPGVVASAERHEHDQHAGHDHAKHTETKEPEAAQQAKLRGPADHDHAKHTETKEPEAPVPGQVKLTPEAVQQAKIETAPVVLGPLDNPGVIYRGAGLQRRAPG